MDCSRRAAPSASRSEQPGRWVQVSASHKPLFGSHPRRLWLRRGKYPAKFAVVRQGVPRAGAARRPRSGQITFNINGLGHLPPVGTPFASRSAVGRIGEQRMTRTSKLAFAALAATWVLTMALPTHAASRIKDLANIEGVR